jgi:peptidoglycan/LPS O-acetylase OafA/YrhL
MSSSSPSSYRADIDGLRALAVLAVLSNHLSMRDTGGYVGVDLFFVISGYLISAHILAQMNAGTFSLGDFYERRVRRIAPALLAVLLVCSLVAPFFLLPSELMAYGRSLLAALLSVSNNLFWHESGYFDSASRIKPLLHTWSLGVEEQFYIAFPLLLLLVRRLFPARIRLAIWLGFALSLAAAVYWMTRDPAAAFYLFPLRAWELLLGTLLSQRYLPALRGPAARHAGGVLGLLLILVPLFAYSAATPFPGLAAAPPCLGAVLIIAAGEHGPSLVGRLLSWRPLAFIGLISYSLYLWHWPLLVLVDGYILLEGPAGRLGKLGIVLASLLLATLSWRFVETPFRAGASRPNRRRLFQITGAAALALAGIAAAFLISSGLAFRFPPEVLAIGRRIGPEPMSGWRVGTCLLARTDSFSQFSAKSCLPSVPGRPEYLLIGDSHAAALYPGLAAAFPERNVTQATVQSCVPLIGEEVDELPHIDPMVHPNCRKMRDLLYGSFLLHDRPAAVVLEGAWLPQDLAAVGWTVAWLQQRQIPVIVVGSNVRFTADLPRLLTRAALRHDPGLLRRMIDVRPRLLDAEMSDLARTQWHVPYVSYFEDVCGADAATPPEKASLDCPLYAPEGTPVLFDGQHLTQAAALQFAQAMRARHQLP